MHELASLKAQAAVVTGKFLYVLQIRSLTTKSRLSTSNCGGAP